MQCSVATLHEGCCAEWTRSARSTQRKMTTRRTKLLPSVCRRISKSLRQRGRSRCRHSSALGDDPRRTSGPPRWPLGDPGHGRVVLVARCEDVDLELAPGRAAVGGVTLVLNRVAGRIRGRRTHALPHEDEAARAVGGHRRPALWIRREAVHLELRIEWNHRMGRGRAEHGR